MFIPELDNNKEIEKLLFSAKQLDCAVAFIGHGAEQYFKNKDSARLICNLTSGSTNPDTIQELQKMGVALKNCSNLHAKVYLTPNTMIVSSSNLSANGLGLEEEEIKGWRECGVKVEDQNEIQKAQDWFNGLWNEYEDITEEMIEVAKIEWKKRQVARPRITAENNFVNLLLAKSSELLNRQIYFAIYFARFSDEAKESLKQIKEYQHSSKLTAYENWKKLPSGAHIINIYIGRNNVLYFEGINKSPDPKWIEKFIDSNGDKSTLFMCFEVHSIDGMTFDKNDLGRIRDLIRKVVSKHRKKDQAICLPVLKVMKLIE